MKNEVDYKFPPRGYKNANIRPDNLYSGQHEEPRRGFAHANKTPLDMRLQLLLVVVSGCILSAALLLG